YCRSGNRSGQAVGYLQQQGFTNIYNGGSLEEASAL
ncbi:MAG TPA: rhodanese-like domain-containing protein, partial [Chitinophagaceae bacterium]|nr:rhodanese-like domain-containing protein [Chitinophagaceae bacterium]